MKTILVLATFLIAGKLLVAQEVTFELEDVTVSAENSNYLTLMKHDITPEFAMEMHEKAVNFDVINGLSHRKNRSLDYFVEFKTDKGSMYATYDNKGTIVKSLERYTNILLPKEVMNKIINDFKGWGMTKCIYTCLYKQNKILKREYRLKLQNGSESKVVTIDF